ncbi:hypothetical protein Tco_1446202, partial [Tanacetum coccineum]
MGQSMQTMHMLTKPQAFYDESHKITLGYQNPFYLSQARRKVPALYDGHTIVKTHDLLSVIDTDETLELAEDSRLKMLAKQNDPSLKEKKINIAHVDYVALNKLFGHFIKHFVPQKQLSAEHAFWLHIHNPKEIPCELPSINLVKDKKYHEIQKKKISLNNDRILKHIICQDVMNIVMHADSVPINVLPAINKSCVNDNLEIDRLEQENNHLFELLLSQDIVHICVNSLATLTNYAKIEHDYIDEYSENLMLKNELAKKEHMLDLEPLAPRVLNNRDAHIDYIKHTRERFDTLWEIVKHARALRPLDSDLDYACKIIHRIQEVLVYVKDTCPCLTKPSEKLVSITPLNRTRKVSSTEASGSKPRSNTKKDRISQTFSSNKKKNKVEDHPRIAKSSLNNKNRVSKTVCNANVKHTTLNTNSELICVKCNQCMFNANHDVCFLEFVNDVNVRSKSKSAKRSKKKNIWKPTGKVFSDIGYRWKPTRRTFTIDGNTCPLTRITSTKVVPLKETTSKSVTIQNPEVKVYNRRPKVIKSVGSSSKSEIVESRISNNSEPNQSWGTMLQMFHLLLLSI